MVSVKKWLPFCARQGQIPRWLRDANWHTRRLEDRRLRQISRRRFVTADPPPFIIRVSSREILPCCLPPFFSRLFARNRKSRDQSNERWTTNGETLDRLCGETWRSPIGRADYNRPETRVKSSIYARQKEKIGKSEKERTILWQANEAWFLFIYLFFFDSLDAVNLIVIVRNTLRIKGKG